MNNHRRAPVTIGIILLVVGGLMLLNQFRPGIFNPIVGDWFTWPWIIIGIGLVFILSALISGVGGLAIPGSIITTIGLILNYQWITGNWSSWIYMWALIPASVGLGMILMELIQGRVKAIDTGLWMLIVNLIVFFVLYSIVEREASILSKYWPVLLIILGVMVLVRGLWPRKSSIQSQEEVVKSKEEDL